MKVTRQLF